MGGLKQGNAARMGQRRVWGARASSKQEDKPCARSGVWRREPACVRAGESLTFNCSLAAKFNKVCTQRIEVILLEGLNCFFPKGRGGR